MTRSTTHSIRKSLAIYTAKSTPKALTILAIDIVIYISAIFGLILFDSGLLKFICSLIMGFKMASLFVIGHDAAHDSFTNNSKLNKVVARVAFLPSYHNYSLWLIVHNRYHHQSTNMKLINSWSPLSKQDYDNAPAFKRALERFYRTPLGIPFNYIIERWWKNKFYPFKSLVRERKLKYWLDFLLVSSYMSCQIAVFIYLGMVSENSGVVEMFMCGYGIPILVFGFMVGVSVYQQHTHETVPWFDNKHEKNIHGDIEHVTLHIRYPHWYNVLSHSVMEHTAHHIDPRIPSYNLEKAQAELVRLYGDQMKVFPFSLNRFFMTMKKCKLYDYKNHCWNDFNGEPTSNSLIEREKIKYLQAA